jgi:hypothetical protein
MRVFRETTPRLAALSEAELKAQRPSRSWIPGAANAALDPLQTAQRDLLAKYWRLAAAHRQRATH